ncbi:MAG: aldo/keto reductase [Nitrososphaerota archaeon]|nr:aldo/keto reductase [Nitrososphaerota archaeon]
MALNWLINRSKVVFPIPRVSKLERVFENIGATGWSLDSYDYEILEKMFKNSTWK